MRPHRTAEPSERVVERADRLLPRCYVSRRNRFEVLAHHRGQRGIPVNAILCTYRTTSSETLNVMFKAAFLLWWIVPQ